MSEPPPLRRPHSRQPASLNRTRAQPVLTLHRDTSCPFAFVAPRQRHSPDGDPPLKKIGFLSFGHWSESPHSQVLTAADALLQSIELAVAAEELGADGAYFRVHHFAQQLACPFRSSRQSARARADQSGRPSSTCGTRTRSTWPKRRSGRTSSPAAVYSSGSAAGPGTSNRWLALLRLRASRGRNPGRHGPRQPRCFSTCLRGPGVCPAQSTADVPQSARPAARRAPLGRAAGSHLVGLQLDATSTWAAKLGMNLQSSTLKDDESGEPLHVQQRKQIEAYRAAWKAAGHHREPRISVSRSIFALVEDRDRAYFGRESRSQDQVGYIDATLEPSSAARTPLSRTCWSSSLQETRRSPPPTPCS